ncbi:MAG TPA: hypothetical protein HPP56_00500 [Nitrospirae bacterium]|nr:hypothetical protein [Nitrospirota bacterium]
MDEIKKSLVKSFYNGLLVTCYEYKGKKYVANQQGDWDIYEGEYIRGERTGTVQKDSNEIREIIETFKKQEDKSK